MLALSYYGDLVALDGMSGAELWTGQAGDYGSTGFLAAGQGVVAVLSGGTLSVFAPQ